MARRGRLGCGVALAALATIVGQAAGAQRGPVPCTAREAPGTDLQTAVDRLAGGGTLCLAPGEYRLPRFLSVTRDGLTLRGAGPATVLRLVDGVQSPVVVIGDFERQVPERPVSRITIERLRIVGGGSAGSETDGDHQYLRNSALVVRTGAGIVLRDLDVSACRSACLLTEFDTRDVTIERVTVSGSTWDGISLNRTAHARLVDSTIRDNTAAGITAEHLEDSVLERNTISDNRSQGIYLSDSYRNQFRQNRFLGNTNAGVFLTCAVRYRDPGPVLCWVDSMSQGNVFEGNEFRGNRIDYIAAPNTAATCKSMVPNTSRGDRLLDGARIEQRAGEFGECLNLETRTRLAPATARASRPR